jgi:hypothetical protein
MVIDDIDILFIVIKNIVKIVIFLIFYCILIHKMNKNL